MARYRLRFLLQEFDLPHGGTVIGRSLEANLTLEDPLVSRQHARITVDDGGGTVEDMGSRNGVRVNGVQIRGPTLLKDGDRVRIGTQDFVFCRVDPFGTAHNRTTGVLRLCARCHLPYAREMVACPNCEATEQTDEDTLSGAFGSENHEAWSVQLLVEALQRALTLGRVADAERIVRRVTAQVEEFMGAGGGIDDKALANLSEQALATTVASNDPSWMLWVIDVYRRTDRVPPPQVVDRFAEAAPVHAALAHGALASLLERLRGAARRTAPGDADVLARLEKMKQLLANGGSEPSSATREWPRPS